MKRERQCCLCEEGRKKRKIDLPLSAGEREGKKEKKNMVPIDPRLPDIKKIVLFVVLGNSLRELRRN
jgi:hypothetical protein